MGEDYGSGGMSKGESELDMKTMRQLDDGSGELKPKMGIERQLDTGSGEPGPDAENETKNVIGKCLMELFSHLVSKYPPTKLLLWKQICNFLICILPDYPDEENEDVERKQRQSSSSKLMFQF